jgi:D-arabinose 1-dehydrogenase-like Zn-dependent alcohol dehydrogenase
MNAMVLKKLGTALEWMELADRQPATGEIRVKVAACGVCRTDLHVVDGELPDPQVPIIPGHEIVGRIDSMGAGVEGLNVGQRVGIPWLGHTCGVCPCCVGGRENLCDRPVFTGYTRDGGIATSTIADARFAFPLGESGSDVALAPLLCAGLMYTPPARIFSAEVKPESLGWLVCLIIGPFCFSTTWEWRAWRTTDRGECIFGSRSPETCCSRRRSYGHWAPSIPGNAQQNAGRGDSGSLAG